MATLPTDYTDATTPTGATTEYPATTTRGLNATHTQINTNTTAIATKADSSSGTLTDPTINAIKEPTLGATVADFMSTVGAATRLRITSKSNVVLLQAASVTADVYLGLAGQGAAGLYYYQDSGEWSILIDGGATDVGANFLTKGKGRLQENGVHTTQKLVEDASYTLPAGYSQYWCDQLEFASGVAFEIGAGSIVEIG